MYSLVRRIFCTNKYMRKILGVYYSKKEKGVFRSRTLRKLYKECREIDAGEMSYGWNTDEINGPLLIGRYCSFGPGVRRIQINHPSSGITTHPCWFNPTVGWVNRDFRTNTKLEIGNDVWIGANVIILPSVKKIGNGSIIGAGAVCTKDIGDYEVWGGVPARFIKMRFDKNICKSLNESKWWDKSEDELEGLLPFFESPQEFLKHL